MVFHIAICSIIWTGELFITVARTEHSTIAADKEKIIEYLFLTGNTEIIAETIHEEVGASPSITLVEARKLRIFKIMTQYFSAFQSSASILLINFTLLKFFSHTNQKEALLFLSPKYSSIEKSNFYYLIPYFLRKNLQSADRRTNFKCGDGGSG